MTHITFWVTEGAFSSSITSLIDAFFIANLWYKSLTKSDIPLFQTNIVSTDGKPLEVQGGLLLNINKSIKDIKETDCLILSNTIPHLIPMPDNLDVLKESIKRLKRKDTIVTTVCTGTFLLAEMGFLDGKRATTNWQFARLFKKSYPEVIFEPEYTLTDDDNFICTGAATAVYNLAIHLIKKYGSRKLASICSKALLVDVNKQTQTPYTLLVPTASHGDADILKAQKIIEKDYANIDSVDEIAYQVGISPRHFKRRFKKATGEMPLKYLQKARIDYAKEMLETTRETINTITWAVGYKDISSFSRLFKKHTKISPKSYREKFYCQMPL